MGVNIKAFKPGYEEQRLIWRKTLSIPENAKVLFSPRGWNRHYRHENILQAYAIARERMSEETYLVFKKFSSSPDFDTYQEELLVQAEQLGVKPWVRIMPEVGFEEMPEIFIEETKNTARRYAVKSLIEPVKFVAAKLGDDG
jgi:hypothetical protein